MNRLVCELCGSTDLIKQNGVFVCQSCGCKYSIDEVRKMMVEGTVEVAGTVKVDNSGRIESFLQMAETALESGNHAEAENYANKIIEISPQSYRAWFIKGKAAGWQTTGMNNRYPESILNWINAFQFAPQDKREALADEIKTEAMNISGAILQMKVNSFINNQSENNEKDIKNILTVIKKQLELIQEKTGIEVYTDGFRNVLGRAVTGGVVKASDAADKDFGPEKSDMTRYSWERYTEKQDRCLSLLDQAYDLSSDDGLSLLICKDYILIAEQCRDSCSYKYEYNTYLGGIYVKDYSFAESAKSRRTEEIDEWKKKLNFHNPDLREKGYQAVINSCEASMGELEEAFAIQKYWEEHAEQRRSLGDEKDSLQKQIEELKAIKRSNPLIKKKNNTEENIAALRAELKALGLFKGKEKKAIREQIESATAELDNLSEKIKASDERNDAKIVPLSARIQEIEAELQKGRGREVVAHGEKPVIFAEEGEELAISPADLLRFLNEKLPNPYRLKTGTEEDIFNVSKQIYETLARSAAILAIFGQKDPSNIPKADGWKDDPNEAKRYRLEIYSGERGTKTRLLFNAKSFQAPIEENIQFQLDSEFTPEDAAEFVKIVSVVIFDLVPSMGLSDLQKVITAGVYGIKNTKNVTADGLQIKFERNSFVRMTLRKE